jgi:hypothetical protein
MDCPFAIWLPLKMSRQPFLLLKTGAMKEPVALQRSQLYCRGASCLEKGQLPCKRASWLAKEPVALQKGLLPCKRDCCLVKEPVGLQRSQLARNGACCLTIVICTACNRFPEKECLGLDLPGSEGLCGFDSAFGSFMMSFYQKERKKAQHFRQCFEWLL